MREIALGELTKLTLFNILKTLLVEKKTGVLTIKGKEEGEIYLEAGNVVHAKIGQASGEEAFLAIMGWKTGKCLFRLDTASAARTISLPAEQLLLKWSHRKQELEKIREAIPSLSTTFRLSLGKDSEEKSISGDQWNILALANGMRTVSEIVAAVGWPEYKAFKTIYQLVQAGLLEKADDERPVRRKLVGDSFFSMLEDELKKAMGPVASIIIEDRVEDIGETKEAFPRDQAEFFVESLSEEIANETRRREFVKAAAKILALEK